MALPVIGRRQEDHPQLSVIVPMYNEEDNVERTIQRIVTTLDPVYQKWELIVVDDGSADATAELASDLARTHSAVRVISHPWNRGIGGALRTGFSAAKGDLIVTLDGDLSYDPSHAIRIVDCLQDHPEVDLVVGSPYMRGGGTRRVPLHRLVLSRGANILISRSLPGRLSTVTGILRGYRREALDQIEVRSEGKEVHLELISKALALGFVVREIPAVLEGREHGKSKLKIRKAISSHLLFSVYEKPSLLFGFAGLSMVLAGLATGGYLAYLFLEGRLNPERPLIIVTVVLLLGGLQLFSFGFIATQMTKLRNEFYRAEQALNALHQERGSKASGRGRRSA